VAADALRQWIDLGAGRLPLGAVTAVLGGVAFLVLLRRTAAGWFA
jgi:ABC-type enterobactin transport system permease subunit